MPTIVIASNNPVKIQAAVNGFARMFPELELEAVPVSVPSGVSHQPMTDAETLLGARQRVENARAAVPAADYWIGIEGGVDELEGELIVFAWVVVRSVSLCGKARSGSFSVPPAVEALVRKGVELGVADDMVFGRSNSKQGNGAVGILTADVIDRAALYEHAVALALIPFKNEKLYLA